MTFGTPCISVVLCSEFVFGFGGCFCRLQYLLYQGPALSSIFQFSYGNCILFSDYPTLSPITVEHSYVIIIIGLFLFHCYFQSSTFMMNQTVESVTASLFREYLYRNNYRSTLEAFDKEVPRTSCSITNRFFID